MAAAEETAYAGIEEVEIAIETLSLDDLPGELKPSLAYWNRLRPADTIAPPWRDFDMLQMPIRYLPTAVVVDRSPRTRTYTYRYWGSALTPVFGRDLTNKTFEDCPGAFRDVSYKTYDVVRERREPCLIRFNARIGSETTPFQTAFRMPLSADGEEVTSIVSLLLVQYRKHEWQKLWD